MLNKKSMSEIKHEGAGVSAFSSLLLDDDYLKTYPKEYFIINKGSSYDDIIFNVGSTRTGMSLECNHVLQFAPTGNGK
ncbi:MAG: hypothetical protein QM504_04260 [Pseudomonadota bacterium]